MTILGPEFGTQESLVRIQSPRPASHQALTFSLTQPAASSLQRPARRTGYAIFEVAMTLFLIEYRGDDAGIKQVLHFLKIRSEIRGPNFHGPSFCISFKTRRTSRPYAVVFPVCAVSLVRRA